jgi:hypothetical protein
VKTIVHVVLLVLAMVPGAESAQSDATPGSQEAGLFCSCRACLPVYPPPRVPPALPNHDFQIATSCNRSNFNHGAIHIAPGVNRCARRR